MNFWVNFVNFYVSATQQRFLSPVQLLVNNELFHQSSFYFKNIVLSFQLVFQQRYLHFPPGGKVRGEMSGGMSYTHTVYTHIHNYIAALEQRKCKHLSHF